jgi:anti-sigma factor RsiW
MRTLSAAAFVLVPLFAGCASGPVSMKDCEAMLVELPGYASGKLDPNTAASVKAHLQACAACRDELVQIQLLDKLLKESLPTISPSPGFASRFANRLAAEVAAEDHRPRGRNARGREPAL